MEISTATNVNKQRAHNQRASGKFDNRDVENVEGGEKQRSSDVGWGDGILNQNFFLKSARKYLTERDFQHLRLTCKAVREGIFRFIPTIMQADRIEHYPKIIDKFTMPFPGELRLKANAIDKKKFLVLKKKVENWPALNKYAPNRSIKSIDASWANRKELADLLKYLPKDIEHFECKLNDSQISLDLSSYTGLKDVKVTEPQYDYNCKNLKLPLTLERFKCGSIRSGFTLDLSPYPNLREVKVESISGTLILPSMIERFECYSIGSEVIIDLSSCMNLKEVKVRGSMSGTLILPSMIERFECDSVDPKITLDLSFYTNLKEVKVRNAGYRYENLKLPPTHVLQHFECGSIDSGCTLDLSSYTNLKEVKVGSMRSGSLKLPSMLQYFECGKMELYSREFDLSTCINLKEIKIRTSSGILKLPLTQTLESFEWDGLEDVDLSAYKNLTRVKLGSFYHSRTLKLPLALQYFECRSIDGISGNKQMIKVTIDLSSCINLKEVKVYNIYGGALILPSTPTLERFECYWLTSGDVLGLNTCKNLKEIKIGMSNKILALPSMLERLECGDMKNVKLDLSAYINLKELKVGKIKYDWDQVKLSSFQALQRFECQKIGRYAVVDLSPFINLRVLKVSEIKGKLILSKQYHQSLARDLDSPYNIECV